MTSCILNEAPKVLDETVEGKLWKTFSALAATEGNIYLFDALIKRGLATNDVANFVSKQSLHKRKNSCVDDKVSKLAMKSKLVDALAFAKKLRQDKNVAKKAVLKKYRSQKLKGRNIVSSIVQRYRQTRYIEVEAAKSKIIHLAEKNDARKVKKQAPPATLELLSEVNVFSKSETELGKEESLGPMICDDSLVFNNDEMKILSRGPKFMVRNELDIEDFNVEVEKMLFKQRFDEMDQGKDDCLTVTKQDGGAFPAAESAKSTRLENSHLNVKANESFAWEENAGSMVYNSKSKSFDLGNLRATNYKHNKLIYMPKNYDAERESSHTNRKNEMLRTFKRVANEGVRDSNLSKSELSGLKSLKKRVQAGSLVVAETDKSKRFALLTREQYLKAGLKHTQNDFELSESQVKRIQNSVNAHTKWFSEIFNCGSNWNHSDRMEKNLSDKGEQACAMQLLIKDHKKWHQSSGTPPLLDL